jgi:magnesium transporter
MKHQSHNRYREIKRRTRPGSPPGILLHNPDALASTLRLIVYGSNHFEQIMDPDAETLRRHQASSAKIWLQVTGLATLESIALIGEVFDLHDLALEDVVNVHQRPKAEEYNDHYFFVSHYASQDADITHQLSLFTGKDYVISFQELPDNTFDPIVARLGTKGSRISQSGSDYLTYSLIDICIDSCFPALELLGDKMEELEDQVVISPASSQIKEIQRIKHQLLFLRRSVWPLRDALSQLTRNPGDLIRTETLPYYRDCIDHSIQVLDIIENYREVAAALLEIYLANLNLRMNEILRVLTLIATFFLPLSFITSLYGMNFHDNISPWNMPELSWYFGYPFALLLMLITSGGLFYYFHRSGWLNRKN